MSTYIVIGLFIVLSVYVVLVYLRLVSMKGKIKNELISLQEHLEKKYSHITSFVEVIAQHVQDEDDLLETVKTATQKAHVALEILQKHGADHKSLKTLSLAEDELNSDLENLYETIESYSQLQEDEHILNLEKNLNFLTGNVNNSIKATSKNLV